MSISIGLDPEVEALAIAIGLVKPGAGGLTLDAGFFTNPWDRVSRILSSDTQRAALVTAVERLLAPSEPAVLEPADAGALRRTYPLLEQGKPGQVFVVLERAGAAPGSALSLGIAAEVQAANAGPAVVAELVLVTAEGGSLKAVAGSRDHPLRVEARAPLGTNGPVLAASLLVIAPPNQADSRIAVRMEGLAGAAPIVFDLSSGAPPLAKVVAALLHLALATVDQAAPAEVRRMAAALPPLLGLAAGLPALPLADLVRDPGALRGWLAMLASAKADDGRPALVAWLDAAGKLLGAAALPASAPDATEDDPVVLVLLPTSAAPGLAVTAGIRTDAASGSKVLVVGLRAELPSSAADARVRVEGVLVALPLSGTAPATVLERLDLRVDAPASNVPLMSESATGGDLAVGSLRAGLRYRPTSAGPEVVPVLELLDVKVKMAGQTTVFGRLDFTDAGTLTAAAENLLATALGDGLGAGGRSADALRTLLGLGTTPAADAALLASAPTRALAAYYRTLRAQADGWPRALRALGALLGSAPAAQVDGVGTRTDPWRVTLDAFPAPAGAKLGLRLALWDEGDAATPSLRLALRAEASGDAWDVSADVQLVAVDLPEGGGGDVRWLRGVRAALRASPPATPAAVGGIGARADDVHIEGEWASGGPVRINVRVENLELDVGDATVSLGTIALPPPGPVDLSKPDLGLGLDPGALWDVARLLLSRCAGSWGGPTARALLALLGVAAPGTSGAPAGLPPLQPPTEGDLASLLREPLEAVRAWLATVLADEVASLTDDGVPYLRGLLDLAQAVLTNRLPNLPGQDLPAPDIPVHGAGRPDAPWVVPLQRTGEARFEVLLWLEPYGPPAEWIGPLLEALVSGSPTPADILAAADALSGHVPELAAGLVGREPDAALALDILARTLAAGDGVVPLETATPRGAGWQLGENVVAAHDALPRAPAAVAQVRGRIAQLSAGKAPADWFALLLAPPLAVPDPWGLLLEGVAAADRAVISLRVVGIPPARVDLGGTPAALWYAVDLADDGTLPLEEAVAVLGRVVDAVRTVKPGAKVALVAHSYLGIVAQAYASARADTVLGLITLAAPLGVGEPTRLDDRALAEAVRLAAALAPGGLDQGGPLDSALDCLGRLLDGYDRPYPGRPPKAATFPALAFLRGNGQTFDLHGVPAVAVAGATDSDLATALAAAMARAALGAAGAPTHLAWGVRVGLGLPAPKANDPEIDVTLCMQLGRVALTLDPEAASAVAPSRLEVHAAVTRPGGWLVAGPGDGEPLDARVRWAELVGTITADGGATAVAFDVRLHDAALRGAAAPVVGLSDPQAPELLDALVQALDPPPAGGGRLEILLDILSGIGLIRRATPSAPAAILAAGLAALQSDAAARFAGRLPPLLDRKNGLLGLVRPVGAPAAGGPWRYSLAAHPVEIVVEPEPWRITVRTTGDGLPIGTGGKLQITGIVRLATLTSEVTWSVRLGGVTLGRDAPGGPVVLASGFLDAPLTLAPSDPAVVGAALAPAVPRLLIGGVLTALLEQRFGASAPVVALDGLLRDPAGWLSRAEGLGDGSLPRADRLRAVLAPLAALAGLSSSAAKPLQLPGGLLLDFADVGTGADRQLRIQLRTDAPATLWQMSGADATLALDLRLDVDRQRHVAPGGDLTLHLPLPGTWGAVDMEVGADPAGLRLAVSTTSGVDLTLLPTVSGLDTLVAAAGQQLLPEVLDRLVSALGAQNPRPPALDDALAVAQALGVYDPAAAAGQGFRARAQQLAKLVDDLAAGRLQTAAAATASAAVTLLRRLLGTAAVPAPTAPGRVGIQVTGVLGGSIGLDADFSTSPVAIRLKALGLTLGAITADIDVGVAAGAPVASANLSARIDTGVGVVLGPRLTTGLDTMGGVRLSVAFRPLGTDEVIIPLAPVPAPPTPAQLLKLAETWVVPLAGTLLLRAADDAGVLANPLWTGASKTIADLLVSAGVATRGGGGALSLVTPLPGPPALLRGILDGLSGVDVPLPGDFVLRVVSDASRYGLVLGGEQAFAVGNYSVALRLGLPQALDPGWGDAGRGAGLLLLDLTDPGKPQVAPVVRLGGLGVRVARKDATIPLVDAGGFRLGAAAAYVRADVALTGAGAPKALGTLHGALELDGLGLLIGAGENASNPVAASLLQSGGSGDPAPANPPFDLLVASGPLGYVVRFSGEAKLRIEVRRTFGPLHIEEISLLYRLAASGPGAIGVSIDGGVSIAGLVLQADDLSLYVPLEHPDDVGKWEVDLAGLGLSLESSTVSVSGGLLKTTLPDGTIDYEGALAVEAGGRGFSALGAYSRPGDNLGRYTSLFVFVAVSTPLGGPPYLFVTGLAGGLGYNRRLLTPRDPASVPSFPLVQAMTGGGTGPGGTPVGPMDRLAAISKDIPPSRGSLWLAAGVRFTTFELLRTTALLTVALDRGLEVSLLGLMQFQLPPATEAAIVSVELALAAKYSTVDRVLSVRASLTRNSWLISQDCQLTGGFAFIVWFAKPEVLLTIGGYSRKFPKPAYYPDVPRLGFHWDVGGGIVVKGESFFALTHSALMLGGSLEAAYDRSPIKIWFSAGLDVIVWWDPLHYVADAWVNVGARFRIKVCFIACATITVSVSLSAALHIEGPPFYATATVNLDIASVTVTFGTLAKQQYLTWDAVRVKYLGGGDVAAPGTAAAIAAGALPSKKEPNGSADAPWVVAPVFSVRVETKMPASGWRLGGPNGTLRTPSFAPVAVDVVPAAPSLGRVKAILVAAIDRKSGATWQPLGAADLAALDTSESMGRFPGAVWDGGTKNHPQRPMLAGLGAIQLGAAITVTEVTGKVGDVPFSRMVEEETPLPLPFGVAAPRRLPRGRPLAARARGPSARRPPEPPPVAPRLRATLPAPRALRAAIAATLPARRRSAARRGAPGEVLPLGGVQVWDVDPDRAHEVRLRGAAAKVRVTALAGTGAVLADGFSANGKTQAPAGTCSVVVGQTATGDVFGWELATTLLYVGSGTLLAPGAALHPSRPWAPPARFGRAGATSWVPAARLSSEVDGLTTALALEPRAPTGVIVRLDRVRQEASVDEVRVAAEGGTLGARSVVRSGERIELFLPVQRLERGAQSLSVTVTCGEGWHLAGVLGVRGGVQHWTRTLGKVRHTRIQPLKALPVPTEPLPRVSFRAVRVPRNR